jgi:hypothetical protein
MTTLPGISTTRCVDSIASASHSAWNASYSDAGHMLLHSCAATVSLMRPSDSVATSRSAAHIRSRPIVRNKPGSSGKPFAAGSTSRPIVWPTWLSTTDENPGRRSNVCTGVGSSGSGAFGALGAASAAEPGARRATTSRDSRCDGLAGARRDADRFP